MTTLNTGLPIDHQIPSKLTPALRISIQKATSSFQKDFCYDFLQAIVDEPEISDSIGIRLFLNFCLKKPETLIESWNDSIDQTLDLSDLYNSSDSILIELDNFLDFIDGLIQIINTTDLFKLAYHEIDAWNLCFKLLDSIQRKLYDLAILDLDASNSNPTSYQLTIASDSSSSSFYQAFMSLDKYLKHTFDSRVLLEPAKLVDNLSELNERQTELKKFRTQLPTIQSSTVLTKKFGRFGREELAIDQFLESDKYKELIKLKNSVGGAQLTRQPSTRVRKSKTQTNVIQETTTTTSKSKSKRSSSTFETESNSKRKSQANQHSTHHTTTTTTKAESITSGSQPTGAHIDPYLLDVETSPILGQIAFADAPISSPSTNQSSQSVRPPKTKNHLIESSKKLNSSSHHSASKPNRKRKSHVEKDELRRSKSSSSVTSNKKRKAKIVLQDDESDDEKEKEKAKEEDGKEQDDEDGVFVIEKIIGEKVDEDGQMLYKVLWAGYPESEATWQAFDTLEDCAAIDVWEEEKKTNGKGSGTGKVEIDADDDAEGEIDEDVDLVVNGTGMGMGRKAGSPAAIGH